MSRNALYSNSYLIYIRWNVWQNPVLLNFPIHLNNCLHIQSYLQGYVYLVNILQDIYTKKCQLFMMDCTELCFQVHHLHHHLHHHWEHRYHYLAHRSHFDSTEYKSYQEILWIRYCFIAPLHGLSQGYLHETSLKAPEKGEGLQYIKLYGYVPLWRVRFSHGLVWDRV